MEIEEMRLCEPDPLLRSRIGGNARLALAYNIGRGIRYAMAVLSVGAILSCSPAPDLEEQDQTGYLSKSDAQSIAEKAFVDYTEGEIMQVSVDAGRDVGDAWEFLFIAEGQYARPGGHWWVRVDKKTGEATVIPGF